MARDPQGPAETDPAADPEAVARSICLRQLAAAPRTRAQLADTLHRRHVPADAAARVLARLAEVGLVDDVAFAEAWVRSRHTGRGLAGRALQQELRARGVSEEVSAAALRTLAPEEEAASAQRLAEAKLRATRGLDLDVRVRRVTGVLARRGYPTDLALAAVRAALAVEGADPEEVSTAAAEP